MLCCMVQRVLCPVEGYFFDCQDYFEDFENLMNLCSTV